MKKKQKVPDEHESHANVKKKPVMKKSVGRHVASLELVTTTTKHGTSSRLKAWLHVNVEQGARTWRGKSV